MHRSRLPHRAAALLCSGPLQVQAPGRCVLADARTGASQHAVHQLLLPAQPGAAAQRGRGRRPERRGRERRAWPGDGWGGRRRAGRRALWRPRAGPRRSGRCRHGRGRHGHGWHGGRRRRGRGRRRRSGPRAEERCRLRRAAASAAPRRRRRGCCAGRRPGRADRGGARNGKRVGEAAEPAGGGREGCRREGARAGGQDCRRLGQGERPGRGGRLPRVQAVHDAGKKEPGERGASRSLAPPPPFCPLCA